MTTDFTTTLDPGTSLPLKYECTSVMEGDAGLNRIGSTPVQFYYDLAWDPTAYNSAEEAALVLQSNLASQASHEYEILPDGMACVDPPRDKDLWLVGVNVGDRDIPNTDLDDASACQELVDYPAGYQCHFMTGTMAFSIVGPKTTVELVHFIKDQYRSTEVTLGSKMSMRAQFVATQIDTSAVGGGRDELPTQITSVQEDVQTGVKDDEDITPEGGVFVAGMVVVSALFATIMFRRFRRKRNAALAKEVDAIIEAEQDDNDDKGNARDSTFELEHSMDAMSDDDDDLSVGRYDVEEDEEMVILPQRQYSFDMGGVMKNELLGVYGDSEVRATGITTSPSEAESEDVDSWAQTEGSIGSIELHLEPITAEV